MTAGIDRFKASSHPTQRQGIYLGIVKQVTPDNKAYVFIPKLANTIGPMRAVSGFSLAKDIMVLCAHVGGGTEEMYILGTTTAASALVSYLNDIGDVVITSSAANDILKWNGSAWVNDSSLLAAKANLAGPTTFTGTVTLPTGTIATTQSAGTNTTQLATTQFVTTAVVNVVPQSTVYTTGSGTYTVPSGARWLSVKMVGGGGGGATGHSTGAANGLVGGNTTFGTGIASGGGGGLVNDNGGIGVASTMISGGTGLALAGGDGGPSAAPYGTGRAANEGGNGGSSAFGGGGSGRGGSNAASGVAGKANTGGGGGAGGGSNVPGTYAAGGGASGGYVECIIASPSATYSYAVGTGGAGGSNGSTAGGAGGSGVIYVVAYF